MRHSVQDLGYPNSTITSGTTPFISLYGATIHHVGSIVLIIKVSNEQHVIESALIDQPMPFDAILWSP